MFKFEEVSAQILFNSFEGRLAVWNKLFSSVFQDSADKFPIDNGRKPVF